jgi:hypothetical protein
MSKLRFATAMEESSGTNLEWFFPPMGLRRGQPNSKSNKLTALKINARFIRRSNAGIDGITPEVLPAAVGSRN